MITVIHKQIDGEQFFLDISLSYDDVERSVFKYQREVKNKYNLPIASFEEDYKVGIFIDEDDTVSAFVLLGDYVTCLVDLEGKIISILSSIVFTTADITYIKVKDIGIYTKKIYTEEDSKFKEIFNKTIKAQLDYKYFMEIFIVNDFIDYIKKINQQPRRERRGMLFS